MSTSTKRPAVIRVIDVNVIQKGNLKAFADVAIGPSVKIYGFRIIQQPGQKVWVSPPQRTWEGEDGKPKYAPVVELSGDLRDRVDAAILQAYGELEGI